MFNTFVFSCTSIGVKPLTFIISTATVTVLEPVNKAYTVTARVIYIITCTKTHSTHFTGAVE